MKTNNIHAREILSWIALACAIALFSISYSIAQDKKPDKNAEIKIKIQKDENGKKTKIDTTISADQLPALKEYLKDFEIDFDADIRNFNDGDHRGSGHLNMHFRHPEMSKEGREAFEKEMKMLREEMKSIDHGIEDLHIKMFGLDDDDPENFDLQLQMPGAPLTPCPPSPPGTFYFYGDSDEDSSPDSEPGKNFSFRLYSDSDEVPDSLKDEQHIIHYGAKGEKTPVFEKEITSKAGEKIFVFKRILPEEETAKATPSMPVTKLKVYPNPGNGKITLDFNASKNGDVEVTINDAKGNQVYSRKMKKLSGEFHEQIDISVYGKGTYFLKITQGDDSITKKLVVE